MKNVLKGRGLGLPVSLTAGAAALAGAVLYLILDGADKTFAPLGFALALAGAASTALVVFTRLKFAPLVPFAGVFLLCAVLGAVACFAGTDPKEGKRG